VFGDYELANARLAEQGLPPDINWYDYLADYPFLMEYQRRSPRERGIRPERVFAPGAMWRLPEGY